MLVRNHAIGEKTSSGSLGGFVRLNPLALDYSQVTQGQPGEGKRRSLWLHQSS
jgi:hypothetical protein